MSHRNSNFEFERLNGHTPTVGKVRISHFEATEKRYNEKPVCLLLT